ncbi:MAG: hypothetical protein ABGX78_03600 [Microbacterium sp.]|nr:hypothetical protein [Microbacterium schleiferi]
MSAASAPTWADYRGSIGVRSSLFAALAQRWPIERCSSPVAAGRMPRRAPTTTEASRSRTLSPADRAGREGARMEIMSPTSDDHLEQVTVRRSPKYSVFLLLGGAVGLLVAMILTFLFDGTTQESPNTGLVYSQMQVFGFLLLIFVSIGVALGGAVALIFDRVYARRARTLRVEHDRIISAD